MNNRKIAVITGSRADYGLLSPLLRLIQEDKDLTLQLIVTGSHLSEAHGDTFKNIEADGFLIDAKLEILENKDSRQAVTAALAKAVRGFGEIYEKLNPDMVLFLGDRYEILAAAEAALIQGIPAAHIAGGDLTEGAFDDAIRHSLTKMSHLHFATHEEAARRIKQLGENPEMVFTVGSPGLDVIRQLKLLSRVELSKKLDFEFRPKNLLITFHPETLSDAPALQQLEELLSALETLGPDTGLLFTKANADPEGQHINERIEAFIQKKPYARLYASLGQLLYLSLIKEVDVVVGNSSSGLYEAPSFKKPVVNIGDRQKGRPRALCVLDCEAKKTSILKALQQAFALNTQGTINPYGDGRASEKIISILKEVHKPKALLKKTFFEFPAHKKNKCFIVAEAGVNHNGSLELAKRLIDVAAEAGADAVKFQTFKTSHVVSRSAKKADYQIRETGAQESQWEMIKKLELSPNDFKELQAYCRLKKIEFMSTGFDLESLDFLADQLKVSRIKIPSGEITNAPLLLRAAEKGLPIILSTGMSSLQEVCEALGVLAFGMTKPAGSKPSREAFEKAFFSLAGKKALRQRVSLLQCTTEYPTPYKDVHLQAMDTLRDTFDLPTGLSDHSEGILSCLTAAARGACILEKHFTLDKKMHGPDHKASLEPNELKELVLSVRRITDILGSPEKKAADSEIKNLEIARRSLTTASEVRSGDVFNEKNLTSKRPGTGISPMHYWEWLGKKANKNYSEDEVIER